MIRLRASSSPGWHGRRKKKTQKKIRDCNDASQCLGLRRTHVIYEGLGQSLNCRPKDEPGRTGEIKDAAQKCPFYHDLSSSVRRSHSSDRTGRPALLTVLSPSGHFYPSSSHANPPPRSNCGCVHEPHKPSEYVFLNRSRNRLPHSSPFPLPLVISFLLYRRPSSPTTQFILFDRRSRIVLSCYKSDPNPNPISDRALLGWRFPHRSRAAVLPSRCRLRRFSYLHSVIPYALLLPSQLPSAGNHVDAAYT